MECLEEFWDTLQFYFKNLGLKWMKIMKKGGIENNGIVAKKKENNGIKMGQGPNCWT